MQLDKIIEIKIDEEQKLTIKPESLEFEYIYRSATEVHWSKEKKVLYSPKPRQWSYYNWFVHIIEVVRIDNYSELILTQETIWTNIPKDLKNEILGYFENKNK